MARADIPRLLKESKKALAAEHAASVKAVRKDLNAFKKKTLSKV